MKRCPICGSFLYFNSYQKTSTCTDCFWEDNNIFNKIGTMIEDICSHPSTSQQEVATLEKPVKFEVRVNAKNNLMSSFN